MADTGVKYTKPFDKDEEDSASVVGGVNFSPTNRSKTVKILAVVVVILAILVIVFIALFAKERSLHHDCKSKCGRG